MNKLFAVTLLVIMLLAFLPVHEASAQSGCHLVNHTVGRVYLRNGTSRVQRLSDVAARYHTTSYDIAARNGLPAGATLIVGQQLSVLSCPSSATPIPTPRPRVTPVYTGNPCRLIGLCTTLPH